MAHAHCIDLDTLPTLRTLPLGTGGAGKTLSVTPLGDCISESCRYAERSSLYLVPQELYRPQYVIRDELHRCRHLGWRNLNLDMSDRDNKGW